MTTETRRTSKDVAALRTAIVCVGLSGVCLAGFVLSAGGDRVAAAVCAGAGVVVAMLGVTNWPAAKISRPRRIFAYWALAALLVLELMVPVNYVGARRHLRWDWTEGSIRSLSEKSLAVLSRVAWPAAPMGLPRGIHPDRHRRPVFPRHLCGLYPVCVSGGCRQDSRKDAGRQDEAARRHQGEMPKMRR